jgi:Protein of unknown function (DUF1329)
LCDIRIAPTPMCSRQIKNRGCMMKVIGAPVIFISLVLTAMSGTAAFAASENTIAGAPNAVDHSPSSADSIPPGTIITIQNWQNYRRFMPEGMAAMFEGKYFWKMPPDVQMEVGPTVIVPLPGNYLAATEKYAGQVRIIELPDGGLTLQGYRGGIAFPNPQEPHRGWKVLMNLWYRYAPHLLVVMHGWTCAINSSGNANCETYQVVDRQLSFSTDLSSSPDSPGAGAKYFTGWFMVLEPEQSRYSASLNINYVDLSRPEEVYAFLPSLRRYQPVASSGRCAETEGMDWTAEDFRSGLDSTMAELQASYIGHRKILALVDFRAPDNPFPDGFFMPLVWPKPSWAKWQLRDADVIDVRKIPSKAAGYCYGKRLMYIDAHNFSPLWEELFDRQMSLWKFQTTLPQSVDVPGAGRVVTPGVDVELIWDIQRNHASAAGESAGSVYVNEHAPAEFQDMARYTTPAGLNLIMR